MTQLAPLFKSLFPQKSVPPPFKVFQTIPPTIAQPPSALIRPTNPPDTELTGLNIYQKGYFTSSLSLSIKNQFLIFYIPLQIYQVIINYGIFSGSFLDNLEKLFLPLGEVIQIYFHTL